jgi:hypothetical protein
MLKGVRKRQRESKRGEKRDYYAYIISSSKFNRTNIKRFVDL